MAKKDNIINIDDAINNLATKVALASDIGDIEAFCDCLHTYILITDYPTLTDFCNKAQFRRSVLKKMLADERVAHYHEVLLCKAESYLEVRALNNEVNVNFAIFVLKQARHAWSDKHEVEHSDKVINVILNDKEG